MIRLDVHDGSHRRAVTVEGEQARIGRDLDCEVPLPGDSTVSRIHAVISADGDGWQIEDAGSRNGTVVNGRRLTALNPWPSRTGYLSAVSC